MKRIFIALLTMSLLFSGMTALAEEPGEDTEMEFDINALQVTESPE